MATIAVVLNITLNLVLIKKFGITGAAIANAITQFFTAIFQIFTAKKIFRLKTDTSFLIRLGIYVALIAAASLLLSRIEIVWFYSFAIYVIVALMLSFALGLMKIKEFSGILFSDN
jgi:O-antigen/teichoic acid export membrane protein